MKLQKKLTELLESHLAAGVVKRVQGSPETTVTGLCADSRKLQPGFLFVATRGSVDDSHKYLKQVVEAGAVALLVEKRDLVPKEFQGPVYVASHPKKILGELAETWNESPSDKMFCVGITGTNGKTTTSHMVEWLFQTKAPCAVIGTIDHHLGSRVWETDLTTPGVTELQSRLKDFVQAGAQSLSIEVSSHALVQGRADNIQFDVAIFTNLSRDHLDFHKTFEDYFDAKARLFRELIVHSRKKTKGMVINTDDAFGKKLYQEMKSQKSSVIGYGLSGAELSAHILSIRFEGTEFECSYGKEKQKFFLPAPSRHNVYNALASIGAALFYGMNLKECAERLSQFPVVRGRLEPVVNSKSLNVFVDYAHTDDALSSVLKSLHDLKVLSSPYSRIITVFGCGGDRDKGKRPLMAQAALQHSDVVIVTSDNPRTEDPQQIVNDVLAGVATDQKQKVEIIIDRKKAIGRALEIARAHDVILIAGKGHEDYQIIGKEKIHFSDREVVESYL
ncbi:MAG: UDP-N-acetylmuramoyl-L-alanyl-D-glutamate--2,6-diaminopimelate ligase [Bdellovibrionales bacterium]